MSFRWQTPEKKLEVIISVMELKIMAKLANELKDETCVFIQFLLGKLYLYN